MPKLSAPERSDSRVIEFAVLLLIVAVGALLRFHNLDLKSLWYDEALTYDLVQGSLAETFLRNTTENSAPPFFPLLLALVTGANATETALRLPAVIAGILAIPALWFLARQYLPGPLALVPPLLVAIAPTQIEFSQQVREYSLSFTVSVLLILAYQRFLDVPSARRALGLALLLAFGLLIQYGLGLLAAGLGLVACVDLWFRPERRTHLRRWFLAQLPGGLVVGFLALTTLPGQRAAMAPGLVTYLADRHWDGTAAGLYTLLASPRADFVNFAFPSRLMLALTAVGVLLWLFDRTRWRVAGFLLVPVALTVLTALVGVYPFGGIRQDLFLLPLVYVVALEPLRWLANRVGAPSGAMDIPIARERAPTGAMDISIARERAPTGAMDISIARVGAPLGAMGRWIAAKAAPTVIAAVFIAIGVPRTLALLESTGPEPVRLVVQTLERRLAVAPGDPIYVYSGAAPAFRYYWAGRREPWIVGAKHLSGLDQTLADAALPAVHAEIRRELQQTGYLWLIVSHITDRDHRALMAPLEAEFPVSTLQASGGAYLYFVKAPR